MSLPLLALAAALAAQAPVSPPDSLIELARTGSESALVLAARSQPLAAREAVVNAISRAAPGGPESDTALHAARGLAAAFAIAWRDSFLVREVERFARRTPAQRRIKVRADSLRRAGVAAFGRDGPAAAVAIWHKALAGARSIGDTAVMAGVLDNIGAGLVALGHLDSAATYFASARRFAGVVGDARVEANIVGHLGDLASDRGDLAVARTRYEEARALRERIGDTRGVAADLNNLGLLAQEIGDLDDARRQFAAALALNRREGREESAASNLVNLAGLASLEGEFSRASALYRDALATWQSREDWAEVAVALHGLGHLELRRGDYPAARTALEEAARIFERTGPVADALEARRALADALASAGDVQGALDQLDRAQRVVDSALVPPDARAGVALARGDLAMRLNALEQAERFYVEAERLYRQARDADGIAESSHGLAWLFLARENPARARTLLNVALRSQVAAGNHRAAALTRLTLSGTAWDLGDTTGARSLAARAARELERLGDAVASAAALGEQARIEAEAGAVRAAETLYRAALARLGDRAAPGVRWPLRSGLALALRSRGDLTSAARELRAALGDLEQPTQSLLLAERRSAFLADKWDTYAQLALTERARGLPAAAFEASERMRAREMLELLTRGRVDAGSGVAADLVGREQDLRRRISELTRALESAATGEETLRGPDLSRTAGTTRQALLRAQDEYADLLLRIRERAPRHAAFVAPATASWGEVARRLAPDQAFITYLLSDSGSVAFVVLPDTVVAVDLGVGRREVARLVEFVRGDLERPRSAPLASGAWQRLYGQLIAPIEDDGLLAGRRRLIVVPHAELHYLPFAALLAGASGPYLGDRFELTMTPSASVWLALADRAVPRAASGILAFAPRPDALPASRREVEAIQRIAGSETRIAIGAVATEEQFRREAPTRRILHLATYGVLNKQNPLFSFVELAPGGGHDGRLDVHEVYGLSLAAELVVLSACQTALGSGALADVPPGDDWVGLTRAFLHAGAKRVVATLWPVDDWATAAFMEHLHRALAEGATPARALVVAQRALRTGQATSHPYYWAGFVLVGGADDPLR